MNFSYDGIDPTQYIPWDLEMHPMPSMTKSLGKQIIDVNSNLWYYHCDGPMKGAYLQQNPETWDYISTSLKKRFNMWDKYPLQNAYIICQTSTFNHHFCHGPMKLKTS
jgi:hypothetical protein